MAIYALRFIHALFTAYFLGCLVILWYAGLTGIISVWVAVALLSLILEGVTVFIINHGDCPLIHLQRRLGDSKPFFELFLPPNAAKLAVPILTLSAISAVGLMLLQWLLNTYK